MSCALQACCKWKIGIGSIPRFLCSEVRACFSRFSWFYTSCASTALHALREVICHCATVPPNSLCCQPLSQRGRRNLTRLWKPPSSLVSLTRFRSSDLRNLWLHPWLVATSLFSFPSGWRHTWWRGRNLSESCGWNGRACMLWPFLNRERPMKGTHWPFSVQEWPEHARSAIPTYSNHNSRHSSWVSRLPPFGPRAWHKPRKVAAFQSCYITSSKIFVAAILTPITSCAMLAPQHPPSPAFVGLRNLGCLLGPLRPTWTQLSCQHLVLGLHETSGQKKTWWLKQPLEALALSALLRRRFTIQIALGASELAKNVLGTKAKILARNNADYAWRNLEDSLRRNDNTLQKQWWKPSRMENWTLHSGRLWSLPL